MVDTAPWKGGEFDTTLRMLFQKLRLASSASRGIETEKSALTRILA